MKIRPLSIRPHDLAAPVAGLPAIAEAAAGADPVFAAFSAHERAQELERLAWEAACELCDSFEAACKAAGISADQIKTPRRLKASWELGDLSDSEYEAALASIEANKVEYQKMAEAVTQAEDAASEKHEEEGEALEAVFETAPTTRAFASKTSGPTIANLITPSNRAAATRTA